MTLLVSTLPVTTIKNESIKSTTSSKPILKYQVLSASSTKAEYKEALAEVFGADFIPTIECESHFRHYNKDGSVLRSLRNTDGSYDWSWLQLNDIHRPIAKQLGIVWEKMTPAQAVEIAIEVMRLQGKTAWVCFIKTK